VSRSDPKSIHPVDSFLATGDSTPGRPHKSNNPVYPQHQVVSRRTGSVVARSSSTAGSAVQLGNRGAAHAESRLNFQRTVWYLKYLSNICQCYRLLGVQHVNIGRGVIGELLASNICRCWDLRYAAAGMLSQHAEEANSTYMPV
jgi:hypothetical protein